MWSTLYHLIKRIVGRLLEIPQRGLPRLSHNRSRFDEEWGTETEKLVWLTNPSSKNFVHGVRYEACSPGACRWAIETSQIDFPQFNFVDVGSGKGRPLLIASRYPFANLIGLSIRRSSAAKPGQIWKPPLSRQNVLQFTALMPPNLISRTTIHSCTSTTRLARKSCGRSWTSSSTWRKRTG